MRHVTIYELIKKSLKIRKQIVQMIYKAKSGHIGGSLSSVDILVTLFYRIMNLDKGDESDKFVLSKGHSVEGYYAILADIGYLPEDELERYCQFGSILIGHPTNKVKGIEVNTGSLGHGLSVGAGMALAGKRKGKNYRVFVLMGDGELAEGSVWEAAMFAANYKLDNLVAIIDRNKLQISGGTEEVMKLEPLRQKWEAFGWKVFELDGHNYEELIEILTKIPVEKDKPHLIIANTTKGKGVSFIENKAQWHHKVPTEEEYIKAIQELDMQLQEVEERESKNCL
ncbi:Transketolase domain-containing protein [Caldicellulosiruptor owensensis OL]|uniref:Transketolase domain-containing protein n=1 Tax=Caldicellulosiruptor owensensis (strain ATCC 700167 / DSM 13100 / OL) TaxID=632518 RepID=E4Q3F7_CALOW|nr:transketolase [Caldicellulosiruptor owensensis]ADQ03917.1 Transketolase domain-containing protein [Caldicellulosiruptor owensensis OL]